MHDITQYLKGTYAITNGLRGQNMKFLIKTIGLKFDSGLDIQDKQLQYMISSKID